MRGRKTKWQNDGFRTLYESVTHPDVIKALDDWKRFGPGNCVLIGGLALSYYVKPRPTDDLDLIFLSEDDIPKEVHNFKKNRNHSFEHRRTGVEVETLTPEHLNRPLSMFKKVFDKSIESDGIKVASPLCLIALKLRRFGDYDRADISKLITHCKIRNIDFEFDGYDLSQEELERFNSLLKIDGDYSHDLLMSETRILLESGIPYKEFKVSEDMTLRVFRDNCGDPRMTLSRNEGKNVRRFEDFEICITLDGSRIIESSTGFNSFAGISDHYEVFEKWFSVHGKEVENTYWHLNL